MSERTAREMALEAAMHWRLKHMPNAQATALVAIALHLTDGQPDLEPEPAPAPEPEPEDADLLVERIAEAIADSDHGQLPDWCAWDDCNPRQRDEYRVNARAALAVMRADS